MHKEGHQQVYVSFKDFEPVVEHEHSLFDKFETLAFVDVGSHPMEAWYHIINEIHAGLSLLRE